MCGIAGVATWQSTQVLESTALRMVATLRHRGPDDQGIWGDAAAGIAIAHRRLSIIDLSPQGHQPMASASARFVVAYNGEIYNYNEIRGELNVAGLAPAWRGQSDTEVLLAAFDAWGVEVTLKKLVGMFAIALWDRHARTLTLARDRMGEKPMYYGIIGGQFVFGSELKAVRAGADGTLEIDRVALAQFMRFGYVPAPRSIHAGIFKLPAGHFVAVHIARVLTRKVVKKQDLARGVLRIPSFGMGIALDIKPYRLHEVGKKAVVKIERPLRGVALGRHLERAARAVGQGFGLFRAGPHRPRSNNCACVFANGGIAREAEVVVREIGEQIV